MIEFFLFIGFIGYLFLIAKAAFEIAESKGFVPVFWLLFCITSGGLGLLILMTLLPDENAVRKEDAKTCPQCQARVNLKHAYCFKCGHDLKEPHEWLSKRTGA